MGFEICNGCLKEKFKLKLNFRVFSDIKYHNEHELNNSLLIVGMPITSFLYLKYIYIYIDHIRLLGKTGVGSPCVLFWVFL